MIGWESYQGNIISETIYRVCDGEAFQPFFLPVRSNVPTALIEPVLQHEQTVLQELRDGIITEDELAAKVIQQLRIASLARALHAVDEMQTPSERILEDVANTITTPIVPILQMVLEDILRIDTSRFGIFSADGYLGEALIVDVSDIALSFKWRCSYLGWC